MSTAINPANDSTEHIQLIRVGDIAIMIPSSEIKNLPSSLIEPTAHLVLASLKSHTATNLIVDLSQVSFFGSEFIKFLLLCHQIVKKNGCELVLTGTNDRIRELIRQTALDILWAIYPTRAEAIDALGGSD